MALAILRLQDTDGFLSRFLVDIGTNRFYTYSIGKGEMQTANGLKLLQDPLFTSPLIGPISVSSLGRTVLEVPTNRFDRQNCCIQITSYKTEKREGIAISEIIKLPVTTPNQRPVQALSLDESIKTAMDTKPVETVPFAYREVAPVSSAMFLQGISSVISKVLPKVKQALPGIANTVKQALPTIANILPTALPLVGNILSGMNPQSGGTVQPDGTVASGEGGIGSSLLQTISNPETAQQIASLLQQVSGVNNAVPQVQTTPLTPLPTITAPLLPTGNVATQPLPTLTAPPLTATAPPPPPPPPPPRPQPVVARAQSYSESDYLLNSTAYALGVPSQYVHEMAIPAALLTALPALMPLLEKALNPETLKTLMENMPVNKLMGTVADGIKQVGQAVQESEKRRFDHIEKIMPQPTNVKDLFAGMSLSLALPPSTLNYQRLETVKLKFEGITPLMLYGRSRLIYHQMRELAFPLSITTPRPIRQATLELLVKNPATLEVLIEEKYVVDSVTNGAIPIVPKLSKERLRALKANEEYLICVTLVWQGKSKQTNEPKQIGTSMSQLITLVDDYCFDRIEGTAEVVPLNDVEKFRAYWHKIWQGNFSKTARNLNFDCKYYYVLESDRNANARMETLIQKTEEKKHEHSHRLKSGLIISLRELNELLGLISKYPRLEEAQLKALTAPEFEERFHYVARYQAKFDGDNGESAALWIYPELKLQQVMLKKVVRTNNNGHVLELQEQAVRFPMPAVAHFIGVRS
ncbi:hypothetical protein NIES4071_29490 [Calothrix sp. NIES-4071]|nr:hypothetical protein NIES4071_29490 [Calothrix sp. NIES-4071]BAZ57269.1 hypothetical protein NIES4105_29430 [Calothrix sp. NIES-4105]